MIFFVGWASFVLLSSTILPVGVAAAAYPTFSCGGRVSRGAHSLYSLPHPKFRRPSTLTLNRKMHQPLLHEHTHRSSNIVGYAVGSSNHNLLHQEPLLLQRRALITPKARKKGGGGFGKGRDGERASAHDVVNRDRRKRAQEKEQEGRERQKTAADATRMPEWNDEKLSEIWDQVFDELTQDPDYAEEIDEYAIEHHKEHGRGVVFVRAAVQWRPASRAAKLGFFEHPEYGEVIGISDTLLLQSMEHDYVTVEELRSIEQGGVAGGGNRLEDALKQDIHKAISSVDLDEVYAMTIDGREGKPLWPYEASAQQLVLLLCVDVQQGKASAIGADLVQAITDDDEGETVLMSLAVEELMAKIDLESFFNDDLK